MGAESDGTRDEVGGGTVEGTLIPAAGGDTDGDKSRLRPGDGKLADPDTTAPPSVTLGVAGTVESMSIRTLALKKKV